MKYLHLVFILLCSITCYSQTADKKLQESGKITFSSPFGITLTPLFVNAGGFTIARISVTDRVWISRRVVGLCNVKDLRRSMKAAVRGNYFAVQAIELCAQRVGRKLQEKRK